MTHSLPDVQNQSDSRSIPLERVGVRNVLIPLTVDLGEGKQSVQASCDMAVNLSGEQKGTNMSRPVEQLALLSKEGVLALDIQDFLKETLQKTESDRITATFRFPYFLEKSAPKSGRTAPMPYHLELQYRLSLEDGEPAYDLTVGIRVLANNCCPCSKAISEGGAHNQRIELTFRGYADETLDLGTFSLSHLIQKLESAASSPLYPILKRIDEKAVTEQQYQNPRFVEDVLREGITACQDLRDWGLLGFHLSAQAQESIHAHDAYGEQEVWFVSD